jgi:seryl-tRNA synthetase
MEETC